MQTTRRCARERRARRERACILAFVVVLAVLSAWIPGQAGRTSASGKVLQIDIRSLKLLLQSDPTVLLIDVRRPEELTGPLGKIFEARNVPLNEIEKNPEQFPRGKTLVFIDRSGHRSLQAAKILAEHGYVVYAVKGGMEAWHKLHPLVRPPSERKSPSKPGVPGPPPEKNFFDNRLGC